MSLATKVGSFTVPAATGNQAVTGLGFQPKAVIFFGDRRSADGGSGSAASNGDMSPFWGMAVSSASRVAMYDNQDFTDAAATVDATKCFVSKSGATTNFAADLVSMDGDGFTVNFATANATAYVVNYIALGGSDLTNVAIVSFTANTATGNQAVTGAGFKPDALIAMCVDKFAGAFGAYQIGFGVSATQRGTSSANYDGTNAGRYQANDKFIGIPKGVGLQRLADLVTLDADGFTVNWTTAAAAGPTVYALCLKGGQYFVGSFTQKTSTGSQSTTGVGFTPTGLLMTSVGGAHSTSVQSPPGLKFMTGAAASASARAAVALLDGSNAVAKLDRALAFVDMADNSTPTVNASADLTSFDVDGFTLNFGVADATAREVVFIAFGSVPTVSTTEIYRGEAHRPAPFKPMGDAFRPGKFRGFR
jgi:hypothetical protein